MAYRKRDPEVKAASDRRYRERHGEVILARKRELYAEKRLEVSAQRREDYAADIDANRAKQRDYLTKNAEAVKARRKSYYQANAPVIRAQSAAAKLRHPDTALQSNRKRRALARGVFADLTPEQIAEITAMQGGKCAHCNRAKKLTLDHIKPLSKGGLHTRRNIQMLCGTCNAKKGPKDPIDFARFEGKLL